MKIGLKNKIAIVTGATSGIGEAIAEDLLQEGVILHAVGRNQGKFDKLQRNYPNAEIFFHQFDLGKLANLKQLHAEVTRRHNRIDILIHCAGIFSYELVSQFSDRTYGHWDELFAINVKAPICLTQLFTPNLVACEGQVVFINSSAVIKATVNNAVYASSKNALRSLTEGLRDALNPNGVRITSIYPGRTATPMQEAIFAAENRRYQPNLLMKPQDISVAVINILKMEKSCEITDLYIRPRIKI